MNEISASQREQWRVDAEAHADETRHPSGYYPSARIIALLDALESLAPTPTAAPTPQARP